MLFALFVTVAAAQQACYYAPGRKASSNVVPCGLGSGVSSCCQRGDFCLEDSACWNEKSRLSYLYGCTDPTYTDANCPWKCGSDFTGAPYVGLTPCFNSTQNNWICTSPPDNGSTVVGYPPPQCLGEEIIAFAGPSTLPPIVSLPQNSVGTSAWFSSINATAYRTVAGFTPSTLPTPSASRPVSVEYLSYSPTPTSTASSAPSTSSSAAPNHYGLSSGAKIGIGVGVGVGVPIVIAALVIRLLLTRKREPAANEPELLSEKKELPELPPEMRSSMLKELAPEGRDPKPSELPDNRMGSESSPTEYSYSSVTLGSQKIYEMPADSFK